MATFDVSQDLFRKLVSMLTDWLKALDELTQEEEGVFKASQELHNLNADHKCTSSVDEIMYSVRSTYECNKSANQQLLLKPLEKICAVLPSINDIFIEREEILKEITQKSRKIRKSEPIEHGAEISTKLRKISQTVDSLKNRLQIIEALINVNLAEFISMLEAFLSSSFHDHLRCTSEFFLRASTIHHQISQALSTGPSQLSLLDKKMDEDINSICKLLHLKPDK